MDSKEAKRIARMITKNVRAFEAGILDYEQFGLVNRATWELVSRGEANIIGSACDKRHMAVQRQLERM